MHVAHPIACCRRRSTWPWTSTDAYAIDASQLKARIAQAAARQPQPEIHLRGARTVPYEKVAQVMAAAQAGGLEKIGFVLYPGSR